MQATSKYVKHNPSCLLELETMVDSFMLSANLEISD